MEIVGMWIMWVQVIILWAAIGGSTIAGMQVIAGSGDKQFIAEKNMALLSHMTVPGASDTVVCSLVHSMIANGAQVGRDREPYFMDYEWGARSGWWTPLLMASRYNFFKTAQYLLLKGASQEGKSHVLPHEPPMNPLQVAAWYKASAVIILLLQMGADPNAAVAYEK